MKQRRSVLLIFFFVLFAVPAVRAGVLFDLEGSYLQEGLNTVSSTSQTRTLLGVGAFVSLENRDQYFLGLSYLDFSSVSSTSAGSTYLTAQDLMLMGRWVIGRDRLFHVVVGFGPFAKAGFREAGATTTELWTGTSLYARVAIAPEVATGLSVGVAMTYYSQSISKREISNTTSTVSYSSSHILPSVTLSYLWSR